MIELLTPAGPTTDGDTNSNGSVKFSLIGGAPMGLYQAEVAGRTRATQVWSAALDEDNNPDTFIR